MGIGTGIIGRNHTFIPRSAKTRKARVGKIVIVTTGPDGKSKEPESPETPVLQDLVSRRERKRLQIMATAMEEGKVGVGKYQQPQVNMNTLPSSLDDAEAYRWAAMESMVDVELDLDHGAHGSAHRPGRKVSLRTSIKLDNTLPSYVIIQDFIPTKKDEIYLAVGHVVTISMTFTDGFCHGFNTTTNESGLFPLSCIAVIKTDTITKKPVSTLQRGPSPDQLRAPPLDLLVTESPVAFTMVPPEQAMEKNAAPNTFKVY
ncbi:hypothetical protein HDU76_010119 [Blyttiomyces sp. JEL0837]|nr:hypothetical protein HDU76_010119 [Blyttiomyces sp. JEL0837]